MRLITFFALATSAFPLALDAQEDVNLTNAEQLENLLPYQKAFTNLPLEKRTEFVQLQRNASRLFSEKRILETLEVLKQAEKLFDQSPELFNLRGSCYVEMRAFDKALASFEKASAMSEGNHSIRFNMGEVYFVTQNWEKAHQAFASLLRELPEANLDLRRITEFKLMLCKIRMGKKEEAKALAEKYDFLDDSPYHYYAKAALAYEEDDAAEAEKSMARANRIFRNPVVIAPWQDTMVEFGYIKSFYGDIQ